MFARKTSAAFQIALLCVLAHCVTSTVCLTSLIMEEKTFADTITLQGCKIQAYSSTKLIWTQPLVGPKKVRVAWRRHWLLVQAVKASLIRLIFLYQCIWSYGKTGHYRLSFAKNDHFSIFQQHPFWREIREDKELMNNCIFSESADISLANLYSMQPVTAFSC